MRTYKPSGDVPERRDAACGEGLVGDDVDDLPRLRSVDDEPLADVHPDVTRGGERAVRAGHQYKVARSQPPRSRRCSLVHLCAGVVGDGDTSGSPRGVHETGTVVCVGTVGAPDVRLAALREREQHGQPRRRGRARRDPVADGKPESTLGPRRRCTGSSATVEG